MDTISNQGSLVVLIISIITGTYLSNLKDQNNSILKKCNYYSLLTCVLFILVLVNANKQFLHELNEEIISILLLIYLILYCINYIGLLLYNFYKNDKYPISVRYLIIIPISLILCLVLWEVYSIEVKSNYIPKDTIVRAYDSNNNSFLMKTQNDTPIKIKSPIQFESEYHRSFKFIAVENKVILKENTKIGLFQFSNFLLYEIEKEDSTYIKDWIHSESNGNVFSFYSESSFALNKDIDVTLVKDTVLTIYYNSVLDIIRWLVPIAMMVTIGAEILQIKFLKINPKKMKRKRKRYRNRIINDN